MIKEVIKILVIDSREPIEIIRKLKGKSHLGAKEDFIEVGDYLLPNGYAVERKKGRDLMGSVMNNRLYEQINNLCQYEHPIVAIITDNKWRDFYHTHSRYIHKQYTGTLTTLVCRYDKLKVIHFDSDDEFVDFLESLYKKITDDTKSIRPSPATRKARDINEDMENMLTVIKGVGVPLSKKLLKHYGTVANVVNASVDEHQKIEKVGKKLAEKIYNICNTEYKKNNKK